MLKRNGLRRSVNDAQEQRQSGENQQRCRKLSCIPSSAYQSSKSEFICFSGTSAANNLTTLDSQSDVSRIISGLPIRRAKKRVNLTNDKRMKRFDNAKYTRLQFLRAVSHAVGSDKMISDSQSDADDDDDTEDEDDRTQPQTAANTSDDDGTTSTVSADAVDSCEVCFVAPRDARFALVPCGRSSAFLRVVCQRSARPKPWLSS